LTNLRLFRGYDEPIGLLKRLKTALAKDTLKDASEDMFSNVEKGSKAEMALELLYLTEPGDLEPPIYISDGLRWLEKALDARKLDVLCVATEEVNNA
jgi:hypothetical protein